PAAEPARPLDGEEHEAEQERLEGHLERDAAEFEEPRCRPGQDDRRDADRRVRRPPVREPAEQQYGGEHTAGREAASDLSIGPGDTEDTGEPVDEQRALVVPEGREVEGEARAVLVAS